MLEDMQRPPKVSVAEWLLVAALALCCAPAFGQTVNYALKPGQTNRDISDADLNRPTVGGLTIRVPWSTINPRRGIYDFSEIDQNLAQASRCGYKSVKLIVQTGRDGLSPRWFGGLWHEGAPLPWSPEMLTAHAELMQELGRKYRYRFHVIHVTGPTHPSAEMHPAPGIERVKGYSDAKMVQAWGTAARNVSTAFPTTSAALSISVQGPASRYVDATIGRLRIVLGNRLILQHNALKASTDVTAPHHRLLLKYSQMGVRVGFEMACSATDQPTRFGSRDVMQGVKLGRNAGAEFIDVYPPDLKGLK
jgi:hypothetical protein